MSYASLASHLYSPDILMSFDWWFYLKSSNCKHLFLLCRCLRFAFVLLRFLFQLNIWRCFCDFSSMESANDFVPFTLYYPIKCLSATAHLHPLIVGSCIETATNNTKNCDIFLLMAFLGWQHFQALGVEQTQLSQKFFTSKLSVRGGKISISANGMQLK